MGRVWIIIGYSFLFALTAERPASAASRSQSRFVLDLGGYVDNIEQRMSAPSGYASDVSTISGFARLRYGIALGHRWYIEPQFALMLPWGSSADGSTRTFTSHFDLDLSVPLFSFLSVRTGPAIYTTLIWGTGQSVDLNNGSPTNTDTFFTPDAVLVSFALMAHVGLQFNLSEHWFFNLDGYGLQVMSASRRSLHAAASIGVAL